MIGKKQKSNDEQDWGACNCTSLDETPSTLKDDLFCAHRMFVLAYLLFTIVVFGYMYQKDQAAPEAQTHGLFGVFVWIVLMVMGALIHAVTIFDIKATHYTKD